MQTLAVTREEGGEWVPFSDGNLSMGAGNGAPGNLVHAIMFTDGSVWDAVSGWRHGASLVTVAETLAIWKKLKFQ
jgi:hypothetical protein